MREEKQRRRVGLNFSVVVVGVVRGDEGKTEKPQQRTASSLLTAFMDTEEGMGEEREREIWNMWLLF